MLYYGVVTSFSEQHLSSGGCGSGLAAFPFANAGAQQTLSPSAISPRRGSFPRAASTASSSGFLAELFWLFQKKRTPRGNNHRFSPVEACLCQTTCRNVRPGRILPAQGTGSRWVRRCDHAQTAIPHSDCT
jgi:hypothetical protein